MIVNENEPMSKHTSFKVGGAARYFIKVEDNEELKTAIAQAREKRLPHFILGNGTNLLVSDKGYDGVVITLAGVFSAIEDSGNGSFKVGAATPLGRFARTAMKLGFAGIHKLAGIPGTLGGAIYMNAGAYGQEIGTCCTQVTILDCDGNIRTVSSTDCAFGYRQSIFQKDKATILSATFQLPTANAQGKSVADLEAELAECMAKRKATQPLNMPNAGSTFKRPEGYFAGALIEQAGLKGRSVGGAQVSEKHAGFIVNTGGATAADILALIGIVQDEVEARFGVRLETEVRILGEG